MFIDKCTEIAVSFLLLRVQSNYFEVEKLNVFYIILVLNNFQELSKYTVGHPLLVYDITRHTQRISQYFLRLSFVGKENVAGLSNRKSEGRRRLYRII